MSITKFILESSFHVFLFIFPFILVYFRVIWTREYLHKYFEKAGTDGCSHRTPSTRGKEVVWLPPNTCLKHCCVLISTPCAGTALLAGDVFPHQVWGTFCCGMTPPSHILSTPMGSFCQLTELPALLRIVCCFCLSASGPSAHVLIISNCLQACSSFLCPQQPPWPLADSLTDAVRI